MGSRMAIFLALAILAPLAGAEQNDEALTACAAPPCGWILPTLDIVVDDKLPCGGGQIIYAIGPPDDCFDILMPGESRTYPAQLILKWEVSEEGTYPKEAGQDIVISFSGTANNAPWLSLDVQGEGMVDGEYIIDDVALFHPDNMRTRTNAQGQESLWFWFERDIEITFTRTGDPGPASIDTIETRQGVLAFFIKARSTESGPRFKEGFGIEEFRFNTCTDPAIADQVGPCPLETKTRDDGPTDQDVPGIGWMALLGLCVMLARRQRQ